MITPPEWAEGVAFSDADDGDLRGDTAARAAFSSRLGIAGDWATVDQVHGSVVVEAGTAGNAGAGDAIWTTERGLPIAVFTADCFGVVLQAQGAVGVAHAGWRGVRSGVVSALLEEMGAAGFEVESVYLGPGIGPCCFEVGSDVAASFPNAPAVTSWGEISVDLAAAIRSQLGVARVWSVERCTMHHPGWFSHRGSGASERMAAVAWL